MQRELKGKHNFKAVEDWKDDSSDSDFDPSPDLKYFWERWCKWHSTENEIYQRPKTPTRSLPILLSLNDFWEINEEEFRTLYEHWRKRTVEATRVEAQELIEQYEELNSKYTELVTESSIFHLKRAFVVGMTTTYVAKHQNLLKALNPKVVLVEEAAEVLEANVLSCLTPNVEHLIMIGDHRQLRPNVSEFTLQVESGFGFDLDVSLFERLIEQSDLPHVTLQYQRRMRPQFSK